MKKPVLVLLAIFVASQSAFAADKRDDDKPNRKRKPDFSSSSSKRADKPKIPKKVDSEDELTQPLPESEMARTASNSALELERKSSQNSQEDTSTALISAVRTGDAKEVVRLLDNKADVFTYNKRYQIPLELALLYDEAGSYLPVMVALLGKGRAGIKLGQYNTQLHILDWKDFKKVLGNPVISAAISASGDDVLTEANEVSYSLLKNLKLHNEFEIIRTYRDAAKVPCRDAILKTNLIPVSDVVNIIVDYAMIDVRPLLRPPSVEGEI
jgi:hypothetical protein